MSVTKAKKIVRVRLLLDGQPWPETAVKVGGVRGMKATINSADVVKFSRTTATKGRKMIFQVSDVATSKHIRL